MPDALTPAELRALVAYVVHGGQTQAAEALGCSRRTVRNHLVEVRQKLGATSTAQAFFIAQQQGLIVVRRVEAAQVVPRSLTVA